ncbi:MAG: hypothetical protein ACLVIT_02120 [Coprococcus sp.]|uniref:Prepilin-type cleavage/methylation N-terminal domain protein n=1 Tax=Coprococcus intestinihominis TaxID=3133154 RepID=A0ABV1B8B8_9FIRM|nr:hypothetical protein [Coprococcus catus]MCB6491345.1 hypothetical protein [Coprococcus catus]
MKYQRHNNTSSLFLLELILAVLFFSVASALCIQIFTKAHLMSQDARDLNFAVNEVSSMAEQMPDDSLQDAAAYYDSSYASCEKADAVYVLTVHYEPEDTLLKAHISMDTVADNRNIYTLDVTKHRQRRAES